MADVNITTGADVTNEQFQASVFKEYQKKLVTRPYMGMGPSFPIQVAEDLMKRAGDAVTVNLAGALSGSGVTGASTLEGNEEEQSFYGQRIVVDQKRNAVRVPWMSETRVAFSAMNEGKAGLTDWLAQKVEADIFSALRGINGVAYATATETQKDQWLDDNLDRALFGATSANLDTAGGLGSTGADMSDSLLTIDGTTDVLNTSQITLARRKAQLANPKIRPIRIENGQEYYVLFAHPYAVRDLKADDAWQKAQREAMPRGTNNPIFTGMAGIYDGVIIKETEHAGLITGVGAGGIDVAHSHLCGAQAVILAQAGTRAGFASDLVEEAFDYDDKIGVAIRSVYGIEKAVFKTNDTNPTQHGVVSVFSAAVAD